MTRHINNGKIFSAMDNRLERIRLYKGNVMDFDSYIKDRVEQTKKENSVTDKKRKDRLKKKLDKMNESDTRYINDISDK